MEYQKIINFLDYTPNQATKFMAKIRPQINEIHMKHITPMVKFNLKVNVKVKFMWL